MENKVLGLTNHYFSTPSPGAVNGAGTIVNSSATLLRRLQTGSVKTYAGSVFVGVVAILAYYLWL